MGNRAQEQVAVNVLRWLRTLLQHPLVLAHARQLVYKLVPPFLGAVLEALCPDGWASAVAQLNGLWPSLNCMPGMSGNT